MPLAHISLRKGKPPAYLEALSDSLHRALVESLHRALVESFEVPPDDRFQVIHQCETHELIFDRHYLCGPRSEDFVLIAVTAGRQRTDQVKQAFYRRLVELLGVSPGLRPEDVMVVIQTTQPVDWSFGHGISALGTTQATQEAP